MITFDERSPSNQWKREREFLISEINSFFLSTKEMAIYRDWSFHWLQTVILVIIFITIVIASLHALPPFFMYNWTINELSMIVPSYQKSCSDIYT